MGIERHRALQQWIRAMAGLAQAQGTAGPALMQSDYRIDLILRAVEDEANKRLASKEDKDIVVWDLQLSFSRYWILSMYKALQIVEKGGQHATPGFDALYSSEGI